MTVSAHALNHEIIDDLKAILGEGFDEIVEEQVEQAGIYLRDLKTLLTEGNVEMAMRRAHALKSSAGQIGLQGIFALAKELEFTCNADADKGEVSHHAQELFQTICDEFAGAVKALVTYTRQPQH